MNFGGSPGPWDHSRRLEKLGGVKVDDRQLGVYSVANAPVNVKPHLPPPGGHSGDLTTPLVKCPNSGGNP